MSIHNIFALNESDFDTAKQFIAGIECEIESVRSGPKTYCGFEATDDGSLRNHGIEFISCPYPRVELLKKFETLHAEITYYDKKDAFSPRTSTHVHVNCRPLEQKHVENLVLLYVLFEDFFFAICEQGRRDNIHCVPLTETILPAYYGKGLNVMVSRWHKYTALNLLPLTKLGTVEFRHLQGTDDPQLLNEWLTTLENLWELCQRVNICEATLSDETYIRSWWYDLFRHSRRIAPLSTSIDNVVANNLLDVKLAFI